MSDLIREQEITLLDDDGAPHTFILSKIPAIPCREIMAKYPLSALPKLGDYNSNEETMRKLIAYAAVPRKGGDPIRLSTPELINNHCPDFVVLGRLEMAMLEYNWSFLRAGKSLYSLESLFQKALAHVSKMLTSSSQPSSQQDTPPTKT